MEGFTIDALPDKGLLELDVSRPPKTDAVEKRKETSEPKRRKKAAWVDEDDSITAEEGFRNAIKYPKKVTPSTRYQHHLVDKFESIYGRPKWAIKKQGRPDEDEEEDEDFDVLATAGDTITVGKRLPKSNLGFSKSAQLAKLQAIVNSIQFHPINNIAFIAGSNGQIDIVQVDGDDNNKLNSVILENFALHQAHFDIEGTEIIIGSKTTPGYFYSYEMRTGSYSRVPLLQGKNKLALKDFSLSLDGKYLASVGRKNSFYLMSMKPKEIISSFQLNDEVHSLCFSPDSTKLFVGGDEALIYVYDLRKTNRCLHRFIDDGAISCHALAISPNSAYLASGDQSGHVNCYKFEDVLSSPNPKSIKSFSNLTTPITTIKFNHTSEMAGIASSYAENSMRFAHFPSCTIFSNFPPPFANIKRINAIDISPNSGYIAIGNNIGNAFLYRLNHFLDY